MTVSKIRLPDNTEHDIRAKYLIQSTSSDAVSKEFVARTTTEDASVATIQKIYGNTVKWNQLNRVQNNSATITGDTIIDNKVTGYTYHREANHKYLYRARLTTLTASDAVYLMGNSYTVGIKTNELYSVIYSNNNTTQDRGQSFSLRSYGSGTFGWTDLCIHDLTEMYGAGNEPTIAEFEATYPAGFSPYTTTTLRSVNATAVQSKDTNDNVIGNCDLNIPTLTGKLNGAGSSVTVFPNGMQSNGTTRDELTATSAIKRIADDNSVLSTPQEYIFDNTLQLQYPVVAGGTEMVLPTTGTAPMKMDVIYGNAADAAANMSQNYISVDSMKDFLSALGTQMGGTWSMQYSGGKYTFTFTSN